VTCAACGEGPLALVYEVRADLGAQGLIPTTDQYGAALDDIVECARCGHRQLARWPSEVELLELYVGARADHYTQEEVGQRATARVSLEQIERCTDGRRLLDLGCWVGFLLAEARERGWEVTGVEPSAYAAAQARERLGLRVLEQDLLSADLPEAGFDAIVLGDVIEHLTDPLGALERIGRLLAPGGVLYLTLPDSGSRLARLMGARWWSVIPTHVQYFTRASLALLLRRAGYEPLLVTTAPKTFSVRYYLWRIGGYSRPLAAGLTRVAELAGVADRLWTPDFRDRMAFVARR
jgi:SAM-dependent methyltransferase